MNEEASEMPKLSKETAGDGADYGAVVDRGGQRHLQPVRAAPGRHQIPCPRRQLRRNQADGPADLSVRRSSSVRWRPLTGRGRAQWSVRALHVAGLP